MMGVAMSDYKMMVDVGECYRCRLAEVERRPRAVSNLIARWPWCAGRGARAFVIYGKTS